MKIFNEETKNEKSQTFILILDTKEAKTLAEAVQLAATTNKKKSSFKKLNQQIEEKLCCY